MSRGRRWVVAAAMVATLGLSAPASAGGPPAHLTYQQRLAHIDLLFARAIARADHRYRVDLAHARSASDRIVARNRLRSALTEATREREHEVEALDRASSGQDHAAHPDTTARGASDS